MYEQPFFGRMSRKNFIVSQLLLMGAVVVIAVVLFRDGFSLASIDVLIPILVISTIPQVILTVRRLHDLNISGLWSFFILTPYLSLLFMVYISSKAGTDGANQFGPVDNRAVMDSLLNKIV